MNVNPNYVSTGAGFERVPATQSSSQRNETPQLPQTLHSAHVSPDSIARREIDANTRNLSVDLNTRATVAQVVFDAIWDGTITLYASPLGNTIEAHYETSAKVYVTHRAKVRMVYEASALHNADAVNRAFIGSTPDDSHVQRRSYEIAPAAREVLSNLEQSINPHAQNSKMKAVIHSLWEWSKNSFGEEIPTSTNCQINNSSAMALLADYCGEHQKTLSDTLSNTYEFFKAIDWIEKTSNASQCALYVDLFQACFSQSPVLKMFDSTMQNLSNSIQDSDFIQRRFICLAYEPAQILWKPLS